MFALALIIGIYSYLIFSLGLLGLLFKSYLILLTVIYVTILVYFNRKNLRLLFLQYFNVLKKVLQITKGRLFSNFLIILIVLQAVVNFIGALGPELGFDALWYHLTIPKIYLINHSIDYISGGLFYYSLMPKLTEMLYIAGFAFSNEIFTNLTHFSFGILSLIALYRVARKFVSKNFSLVVVTLFYSNLVVGWMSVTSYVDLARTFFELLALWAFLEWTERKDIKWLIESAVLLGLAISTKLLALSSLIIFTLLMFFILQKYKFKVKTIITNTLVYWCLALLIPLPWFIFSFTNTGNPIYPFFSDIYPVKFNFNLINPLNLSDPISPVYIVLLPIAGFIYKKFNLSLKCLLLYSFLGITIWYLTPQAGGRFILPYLPAFSIVSVSVIVMIKRKTIKNVFIGAIIFLAVFSILYRGAANLKYVPVILGYESKAHFLSNNLNFSYGDFYDTDGYFARKLKHNDMVLLYGFHNLYYVNFPFIDSSYVKKGDMFNYIVVQGNNLPKRFKIWNMIYYNDKTNVKLYSVGGLKWVY